MMKAGLLYVSCLLGVVLLFVPAMGQEKTPNDFILFNIDFVDSLNGWMAGEVVLHTVDGGKEWELLRPDSVSLFWDVDFQNLTQGWVVGEHPEGGIILCTSDGGQTWQESFLDMSTSQYEDIMFLDEWQAWAVGRAGAIAHTDDGGLTWQRQESRISGELDYVIFVDTLQGWAVGEETLLLQTADGGKTWTSHESIGGSRKVIFFDSSVGYLLTFTFAGLLKTTDGGQIWFDVSPFGGADTGYDLFFLDTQRGWLVTERGVVRTQDDFESWEGLPGSAGLYRIFFFSDGFRGWGVRGLYGPGFRHTLDAGRTWTNGPITSIDEKPVNPASPRTFVLYQNYPNPFNPQTQIRFEILGAKENIRLSVFDVTGREVITLAEGEFMVGVYSVEWNGHDSHGKPLATGIYFYRLEAGELVQTKKLTLLR
jgi:photosystem II stability/assembly factor-like uncharacterized protein